MSKSNEQSWSAYFAEPNPGITSYFDRVRRGNDDEYRTPFYKGKSLSQILSMWKPTIDKLADKWPGMLEFENDLAKKVGPLSIQKPLKERMDDIESYYASILREAKPVNHSAIAAVVKEWSNVRPLHLRSQDNTLANMKLSTNSGNPFFTKRRLVVKKSYPVDIKYNSPTNIEQILPNSNWLSTAILGWRGQEGGPTDEDVKQRVIWMFPFGVNICEHQLYQPAIELAQKNELVPAWVSMELVDRNITKLFDTKGSKDLIVCTDFTKFDQHFNPMMQACAKEIITRLSDSSSSDVKRWLSEVFPVKYSIPLAYDLGKIKFGSHGMASGSGGTNFDETIAHRALQYECAMASKAKLNPYSQCLGDDGILSFPGIDVDKVMSTYTAHGLDMNESKQSVDTQECTYLRRYHHMDYRIDDVCVGVYSTYRAIGRLCEQERFYDPEEWGAKMVALRQLSIIENCKYHPLREEFAQFCIKGDKYRLGIDIPGFLDNIESIAAESIDKMPDFMGYTKSLGNSDHAYGIANWWIVKYLKSIA